MCKINKRKYLINCVWLFLLCKKLVGFYVASKSFFFSEKMVRRNCGSKVHYEEETSEINVLDTV